MNSTNTFLPNSINNQNNQLSSSTDKSSSPLSSSPLVSSAHYLDSKIRLILSEPSSPISQSSTPESERLSTASPFVTPEDFILSSPEYSEHNYYEYKIEELKRNQIQPLEKAAESIESGKFLSNAAYSKSEVLKDKDSLFRGDFVRVVLDKNEQLSAPLSPKIHTSEELLYPKIPDSVEKTELAEKSYFNNNNNSQTSNSTPTTFTIPSDILNRRKNVQDYFQGSYIKIRYASFQYDNLPLSPNAEPLFCQLVLYNVKTKQQLCEPFYFPLNEDLLDSLQNPSALFRLEKPNTDIYVVVFIERVLSNQSIEKIQKKNSNMSAMDFVTMRNKSGQIFRQKLFFGFYPLYRLKMNEDLLMRIENEALLEGNDLASSNLSMQDVAVIATHRRSRSLGPTVSPLATSSSSLGFLTPRTGAISPADGSFHIGLNGSGYSSARLSTNRRRSIPNIFSPNTPSTPTGSSNNHRNSIKSKSVDVVNEIHRANSETTGFKRLSKRISMDVQKLKDRLSIMDPNLRRNSIKMKIDKLIKDGINFTDILSDQNQLEIVTGTITIHNMFRIPKDVDICDCIASETQRKNLKPVNGCFLNLDLSLDQTDETDGCNNGLKTLGEEELMLSLKKTTTMTNFEILERPIAQVVPINFLIVCPKSLDTTKVKHKSRNIAIKIMLRSDDNIKKESSSVHGDSNIAMCFSPSFYCREQFSSVTYHEKNPVFFDVFKVKIEDPYFWNPKLHLLFGFYHVTCKKIGKKSETPFAYSYIPIQEIKNNPNKVHELSIYTELHNQYTSVPFSSNATIKNAFKVSCKYFSNTVILDSGLDELIKELESLLGLSSTITKADAWNELLVLSITNLQQRLKSILEGNMNAKFENNTQHFASITTLLLKVMTFLQYLRKYKAWKPEPEKSITVSTSASVLDALLSQLCKFLFLLVRKVLDTTNLSNYEHYSANTLRNDPETLLDSDILRFYSDYIAKEYSIGGVGIHDALIHSYSVSLSQYDYSGWIDMSFFVYDLIAKSIFLTLQKIPKENHEKRAIVLNSLEGPLNNLIGKIASQLAHLSQTNHFAVSVRVTNACKSTINFICLLGNTILHPHLTLELITSQFFDAFRLKLTEEKMECILDGLKILLQNCHYYSIDFCTFESTKKGIQKHALTHLILDFAKLVFKEFPFKRGKFTSILFHHFESIIHYQKMTHISIAQLQSCVATLYFPFFELITETDGALDTLGNEGLKCTLGCLLFILNHCFNGRFKDWVYKQNDLPAKSQHMAIHVFCRILTESKKYSNTYGDLVILKTLNQFLLSCLQYSLKKGNVTCLSDFHIFSTITTFISNDYLQQFPIGPVYKFLPTLLLHFGLAYFENMKKERLLGNEWNSVLGYLLHNLQDGYFRQLLLLFSSYHHNHHASSLFATSSNKSQQSSKVSKNPVSMIELLYMEPLNETFLQLFFELYHKFMCPLLVCQQLLLRLHLYPIRTLLLLEKWIQENPLDFNENSTICELIYYELFFFNKELNNMEHFPHISCQKHSFGSESIKERLQQVMQEVMEIATGKQLTGASRMQVTKVEKYYKLVQLFKECYNHKEVLLLLVYKLKDVQAALEYCLEWKRKNDLTSTTTASTAVSATSKLKKKKAKAVEEDAFFDQIVEAETNLGDDFTVQDPLVILLELLMNPKKYYHDSNYIDSTVYFDQLLMQSFAIIRDYTSQITTEEALKFLPLDVMPIETLRYLLKTSENNYIVKKRLGKGGQGSVLLATQSSTGKDVAMKVVRFEDHEAATSFLLETQSILLVNHPNICKYNDFFIKQQIELIGNYSETVYMGFLIMEYVSGGDLLRLIYTAERERRPFSELEIITFITQLASALDYIHKHGIVHRDIKCENILIERLATNSSENNRGSIRYVIADFGLAKQYQSTNANDSSGHQNSVVGSVYYMSPEIFKGIYDSATDIWSFGVVLYEMLTLQINKKDLKFELQADRNVMQKIGDQLLKYYSPKIVYILENCLAYDAFERLTAKQILSILKLHREECLELLQRSRLYKKEGSVENVRSPLGIALNGRANLSIINASQLQTVINNSSESSNANNSSSPSQNEIVKSAPGSAGNATMMRRSSLKQNRRLSPKNSSKGLLRSGSSTHDIYQDTILFAADTLHHFRLERREAIPSLISSPMKENPIESVKRKSTANLSTISGLEYSFSADLTVSAPYQMPAIFKICLEKDLIRFFALCEEDSLLEEEDADDSDNDTIQPNSELNLQRSYYQDSLLVTMNYFVATDKIMDLILSMYKGKYVIGESESDDIEKRKEVALKIIISWVKRGNLFSFVKSKTKNALIKFLIRYFENKHTLLSQDEVYHNSVDKLMLELKNMILAKLTKVEKKRVKDTQYPDPVVPRNMFHSLRLIDYAEIELARQITLLDHEMFREIKASEWMQLGLEREARYHNSPTILNMIKRFNLLARWVCCSIVVIKDIKQRVARMTKMINLCEHLFQLKNYNSLKAVIFGMHFPAVQRLKQTWHIFQKEYSTAYASFNNFSEICENAEKLDELTRNALNNDESCVPFIGTYISLIRTIEIEKPTFIEDTNGVKLNVLKFCKMADLVTEIQQLQIHSYPLKKVFNISQKLKNLEKLSLITDLNRSYIYSTQTTITSSHSSAAGEKVLLNDLNGFGSQQLLQLENNSNPNASFSSSQWSAAAKYQDELYSDQLLYIMSMEVEKE